MAKVTTIYDQEFIGPGIWNQKTLQTEDWLLPIHPQCLNEILQLLTQIRRFPLPVLLRHPDHFQLPHCRRLMDQVRHFLEQGTGMAVLDRLPMEEMSPEEAETIVWILAAYLGRLVPQKWDGTMIYHVRDRGIPYQVGVRASITNVGLDFHTDAPFNNFVPDYVILLCLQPAETGGLSRALSLKVVHNILRQSFRQHLPRLYQQFYFDRQQEHATDQPVSRPYPIFSFTKHLLARCNSTLIRNGYDLVQVDLDEPGEQALSVLQDIFSLPTLWWEERLQPGQVQWLNNYHLAHTRTAFAVGIDPAHSRHLVRYWVRNHGPIYFD
jgi:alpha-ketoglutarate-dependent taurine dioxygenase